MSELATLNPNHTLELPAAIAKRFQPSDRFIVWMEGDTLHLKRITPSPLRVVAQAPQDQPFSFDEINDIVHEVRRRRLQPKGE
ncbi:MAG: hypothetical protein R3C14_16090 [Caldilineaceae bacterium]